MKENHIEIVQLAVANWHDYKKLRLEALKTDPQAFGATFENVKNRPDTMWIERLGLAQKQETDIILFGKEDNQLVAMIGAYFHSDSTEPDEAKIWGVFVKPEYRGQGIGKKLMQSLLVKLKEISDIRKVSLKVNQLQEAAVRLYQECGFTIFGTGQSKLGDGKQYPEFHMVQYL